APLALLQQDDQQQDEAREDVNRREQVVEHLITFPKPRLYDSLPALCHDLSEAPDLEARAAHQRAVHVGLARQFGDVVRLHAATVQNAAALRSVGSEPLAQTASNLGVYFLRLC